MKKLSFDMLESRALMSGDIVVPSYEELCQMQGHDTLPQVLPIGEIGVMQPGEVEEYPDYIVDERLIPTVPPVTIDSGGGSSW